MNRLRKKNCIYIRMNKTAQLIFIDHRSFGVACAALHARALSTRGGRARVNIYRRMRGWRVHASRDRARYKAMPMRRPVLLLSE